jgi:hypothetical protein
MSQWIRKSVPGTEQPAAVVSEASSLPSVSQRSDAAVRTASRPGVSKRRPSKPPMRNQEYADYQGPAMHELSKSARRRQRKREYRAAQAEIASTDANHGQTKRNKKKAKKSRSGKTESLIGSFTDSASVACNSPSLLLSTVTTATTKKSKHSSKVKDPKPNSVVPKGYAELDMFRRDQVKDRKVFTTDVLLPKHVLARLQSEFAHVRWAYNKTLKKGNSKHPGLRTQREVQRDLLTTLAISEFEDRVVSCYDPGTAHERLGHKIHCCQKVITVKDNLRAGAKLQHVTKCAHDIDDCLTYCRNFDRAFALVFIHSSYFMAVEDFHALFAKHPLLRKIFILVHRFDTLAGTNADPYFSDEKHPDGEGWWHRGELDKPDNNSPYIVMKVEGEPKPYHHPSSEWLYNGPDNYIKDNLRIGWNIMRETSYDMCIQMQRTEATVTTVHRSSYKPADVLNMRSSRMGDLKKRVASELMCTTINDYYTKKASAKIKTIAEKMNMHLSADDAMEVLSYVLENRQKTDEKLAVASHEIAVNQELHNSVLTLKPVNAFRWFFNRGAAWSWRFWKFISQTVKKFTVWTAMKIFVLCFCVFHYFKALRAMKTSQRSMLNQTTLCGLKSRTWDHRKNLLVLLLFRTITGMMASVESGITTVIRGCIKFVNSIQYILFTKAPIPRTTTNTTQTLSVPVRSISFSSVWKRTIHWFHSFFPSTIEMVASGELSRERIYHRSNWFNRPNDSRHAFMASNTRDSRHYVVPTSVEIASLSVVPRVQLYLFRGVIVVGVAVGLSIGTSLMATLFRVLRHRYPLKTPSQQTLIKKCHGVQPFSPHLKCKVTVTDKPRCKPKQTYFAIPSDYYTDDCPDQIGYYSYGPRTKYDPVVGATNCIHNTVESVANRVMLDVKADPKYYSDLKSDKIALYVKRSQELIDFYSDIEPVEPKEHTDYIRDLVPLKRAEGFTWYGRTADENRTHVFDDYYPTEVHLKYETLCIEDPVKPVRVVCAPPKDVKLDIGPYCYTFSKQLRRFYCSGVCMPDVDPRFENYVYCSGYNKVQLGAIYKRNYDYLMSETGDLLCLTLDHSRFDLHHIDEHFKVQHSTMRRCVNTTPVIEKWMKQSWRRGTTNNGVMFQRKDMRLSGYNETASGNTSVGIGGFHHVVSEAHPTHSFTEILDLPIRSLFLGDDTNAIGDAETMTRIAKNIVQNYADIGFSIKSELRAPELSSFCSMIAVPGIVRSRGVTDDTFLFINYPAKFLMRFGFSRVPLDHMKRIAFIKALCLNSKENDIVPFLEAFRIRVLELCDSAITVSENDTYYMDAFTRRVELYQSKQVEEMQFVKNGCIDYARANEKTYNMLIQRYDTDRAEINDLAWYLRRIPSLDVVLDHPLIDKMVQVDLFDIEDYERLRS